MFLCDSQVKNTCYLVMCQGWDIFLECGFHEEPNASEEFDSDGILIAFCVEITLYDFWRWLCRVWSHCCLPSLQRTCRISCTSEAAVFCLSCVDSSFLPCNFCDLFLKKCSTKLTWVLECSEFKSCPCHLPVVTTLNKLAFLGPPFLIWKMRLVAVNILPGDYYKDDQRTESRVMYDLL